MIDSKKIAEWKAAAADARRISVEAYESCPEAYDLSYLAIDAVPALLAEREEMLALLREIEWKGCAEDYDTVQGVVWSEGGCPVCNGGGAHEAGCRLAAFLKPDARTVPK